MNENVFLLHAVLLGVEITFLYDILRILRRVFAHSGIMVSLEDIAFWTYCAGKVFLLMFRESNGNLRWFAVLGALTGTPEPVQHVLSEPGRIDDHGRRGSAECGITTKD